MLWLEQVSFSMEGKIDQTVRRAQAFSRRVRELFDISPQWRPRTYSVRRSL